MYMHHHASLPWLWSFVHLVWPKMMVSLSRLLPFEAQVTAYVRPAIGVVDGSCNVVPVLAVAICGKNWWKPGVDSPIHQFMPVNLAIWESYSSHIYLPLYLSAGSPLRSSRHPSNPRVIGENRTSFELVLVMFRYEFLEARGESRTAVRKTCHTLLVVMSNMITSSSVQCCLQ